MGLDLKISDALKQFKKQDAMVFPVTVTAVDIDKKTIAVKDVDDLEYFDVRLTAAEDDKNSFFILPKIDSTVLVTLIGNDINTLFVSKINEVEKIIGTVKYIELQDEAGLKITSNEGVLTIKDPAGFEIKLDAGSLTLNGSSLGGIVKADVLKTQIDKNTAILQAIQTAITSWTPVSNDGGAAFKALLAAVPSLQRADLSNIKNDKIKHG